jgi:hypothetical protein
VSPAEYVAPGGGGSLDTPAAREYRMRVPAAYAKRIGEGMVTRTFPPRALTVPLDFTDGQLQLLNCGELSWRLWWDDRANAGYPVPGWYVPGVNWHLGEVTGDYRTAAPLDSVRTATMAREWAELSWLVRFGTWERISPR